MLAKNDCAECLQANELGGVETALIVGAAALVLYLILRPKEKPATTAPQPQAQATPPRTSTVYGPYAALM